jgi:hypothetical protein
MLPAQYYCELFLAETGEAHRAAEPWLLCFTEGEIPVLQLAASIRNREIA